MLVGSGAAVVIAYVIRFLAVPTGFIKAGFERIPRDYDDSARGAGASARPRRCGAIHLPLLRPALLGAAIVVFVDCLKELPATLLLRPLNVETLATSIYQFASRGSFEEGALAALLIVAASIGPVAWLTRFSDMPKGRRDSQDLCRPGEGRDARSRVVSCLKKVSAFSALSQGRGVWIPAFAGIDTERITRSRVLQRHAELGFGLRLHLVERDAVGEFDQRHAVLAVLVDGEDRRDR